MALFERDGKVLTCKATDCAYNDALVCRAKDIDVGSPEARCDTYVTGQEPKRDSDMANVAKCDQANCAFNKNMDCGAPGITVDWHEKHADCTTYRPHI